MKAIATSIVFVFVCIFSLNAQIFQTSTYLEQTHVSPKMGTSMTYEFKNRFELGGFYQTAFSDISSSEQNSNKLMEHEFYGAFVACPLWVRSNTSVKVNVRTGVSNGENFVITPSVMASYKPMPQISLGGGVGTRFLRPTLMASLSINLNVRKSQPKYIDYLAHN